MTTPKIYTAQEFHDAAGLSAKGSLRAAMLRQAAAQAVELEAARKDASRLQTLIDAAGRDYEMLAAYQLIGRLREGIDALAAIDVAIAQEAK